MNGAVLQISLIYLFGSDFFIFSFTEGDHTLDPGSFMAQVEWDNFKRICEILKLKFFTL